ncbi:MAG: hypothetical protein RIB93_11935 [Coleofasciculus sp. D1-CHI-01]|uniref:hypothetical protein n=1 Tax=Coleofasciculus sp. D1-CHI-01 TaxID=3068482 RepID=UPI0032FF66A8
MKGKPITFIQNPPCVTNNIRLMDAIAWNISWFGGGDRAGFVVLLGVLSDDLIPKPAPTGLG